MVSKAGDMVNESGEGEEWELGNDERTRRSGRRWSGRSQRATVGEGDNEGGIGWGYGQAPIEGKRDIGKRGIDFDSDQDSDRSDMLDDNEGEW